MKYFILSVLISSVFTCFSQNAETAKGKVFEDLNNNGIYDDNEPGVQGVLVSNQLEVVKTDKNGNYEITVLNPSILFITKPSGYKVPVNDKNTPQFYYIYQPEGSPDLEQEAIKPTGNLPSEINFPLIKDKVQNEFKMLVVADVQAASQDELQYFREDVVSPALNYQFDFVISLGDLTHDDPGLIPGYLNSMALLGKPFYNILGNHDVNYDAVEKYSNDSFKSFFGPEYYSFDYGNVHFIVLENVERFCKKGDVEAYWNCYRGKVSENQLAWLNNDLANVPEDKLIVINQHIAFVKDPNAGERDRILNRAEVFDVLDSRENVLVLAGHRHTLQHDFFTKEDGWNGKNELKQIICSSASGTWWTGPVDDRGIPSSTQIDGVPNGFFIFEFSGNNFIHTFYPAGNQKEQMRIESPLNKNKGKEIIVNVFNSNKYSAVTAQIDDGEKISLKNNIRHDPFIDESFQKYRGQYKSWANPSNSTQIWVAEMPKGLSKGFHTILVSSVDEFNREYKSHAVFEVE
ncbi:MAG: calcineurin-like phosphoesterase C-terminal domain-containing protein [Prolixibacteraceae bacterium]|nr:calcineurin-like phosphoesterase C-terminal domain-containing protein [Prolixibacteraceae bacterium]MBN2773034.1 calcineurin-like phosphoesterase C-terminal domain-containing protein [Prolixibacteraceae bacterium]